MNVVERGRSDLSGASLAHSLFLHLLGIANGLVSCALNDTTGRGELGGTHEVGIDVASCLTAFIDAPFMTSAKKNHVKEE